MIRQLLQGILALLLFGGSFWVSTLVSNAQASPTSHVLAQQTFSTWHYEIVRESDGLITVTVEPTRRDRGGLLAYREANIALASALFKRHPSLEARVVFTHPLEEAQIPETLHQAGSDGLHYELRFRSHHGEPGTIFGAPDEQSFLPAERVAQAKQALEEQMGSGVIEGVTTITSKLTAEQFQQLVASPDVLLIDVAPHHAVADARARKTMAADEPLLITYPPIHWYHEQNVR